MSNYSHGELTDNPNSSWYKIFQFVPEKSRVLDVGCSAGALGGELIKHKQCQVVGIEIDDGDFKLAKKVLEKVYSFNLELEPFPDELAAEKFDVIILADVIEHFIDPVNSLKKLTKLLKPTGRIIFSIPNMAHISVRLQLLRGDFEYGEAGLLDKTHLHFYNHREVRRVISSAGLTIEELDSNVLTYPESFLQKKLSELGLGDSGFIKKILNEDEARTFQFVGYCTANKKPKTPVKLRSSTPDQELTEYIDALKAKELSLSSENTKINNQLLDLKRRTEELVKELDAIKGSRSWKLIKKVAAVKPKARYLKKNRK